MFCKNCGTQLFGDATLCPECEDKAKEARQRQQAHDEWRAQMAQQFAQRSSDKSGTYAQAPDKNTAYCIHCGTKIDSNAAFCINCGEAVNGGKQSHKRGVEKAAIVTPQQQFSGIRCPRCGSTNIDMQVHQENWGGRTVTATRSNYREKGHGCLWWLIIGWWWWMVDLALWVFAFPFRLVVQLLKKKKYVGKASSVTTTSNQVSYRTVHLCRNCGMHWEV